MPDALLSTIIAFTDNQLQTYICPFDNPIYFYSLIQIYKLYSGSLKMIKTE